MTENDRKISDQKDGPLEPRELQETRFTNGLVLLDFVDPDAIKKIEAKVEKLDWALGWIPDVLRSWKRIVAALAFGLMIGGGELVDRLAAIAKGFLP